jgi:hypothetical protein
MTDGQFARQQARVLKAYNRWHTPTGMAAWIVSHGWHRDGTAGKPEDHHGESFPLARASVAWEYLHVTFHWNLSEIADKTDAELDRVVRHEICHALVNEMRMDPIDMTRQHAADAMKHEERVVSTLATILLWCSESGNKRVTTVKARKKPGLTGKYRKKL